MRRIVEPHRIIFVDRNLGWSLLLMVSSGVMLVMAGSAREQRITSNAREMFFVALAGSGALFLTAFWMLFRKRAFIVETQNGSLTVLDRRLTGTRRHACPLRAVRVRLKQRTTKHVYRGGSYGHTVGAIWLLMDGQGEVLFMNDLHGPEARRLATRLAQDLGCPLDVDERDEFHNSSLPPIQGAQRDPLLPPQDPDGRGDD